VAAAAICGQQSAVPGPARGERGETSEKAADHVFTVKGNQATLLEDIKALEIELRTIRTSSALQGYIAFPHAVQVFRLDRQTTDLLGMRPRRETPSDITSLSPQQAGPGRLLKLARGHWEIENRLHRVRDVTFDENRSQVRTGLPPLPCRS